MASYLRKKVRFAWGYVTVHSINYKGNYKELGGGWGERERDRERDREREVYYFASWLYLERSRER